MEVIIPATKNQGQICCNDAYRLDGIGDAAGLVPFDLALDVLDLLQLIAQLDDGEVDHTWVEAEGASNGSLDGTRGIESHDEVMALAVSGLVLGGDLGQAEGTPVCIAANDAAGADDLNSGVTGDPVLGISYRPR
jgi:hypothetical protein